MAELDQIKRDIEEMGRTLEENGRVIEEIKRNLKEHTHNGVNGGLIQFDDLASTIKTVNVAGDLTNILASTPRKISEQVFIDTTTATKKLYVYDMPGAVWRSVTIA